MSEYLRQKTEISALQDGDLVAISREVSPNNHVSYKFDWKNLAAYLESALATSAVNLIRNSNDVYNQIAGSTTPEWWTFTGSGSAEIVSAATAGISGAPNDLLYKITSAAASDNLTQNLTNDDEPQLKGDTGKFSSGVWVYVVSGTWEWHIDIDGVNEYDSGTITASAWTFLSNEDMSVGSTDIDFIFTESTGTGVMYFTMPVLNRGEALTPYKPRGLTKKRYGTTTLVSVAGGAGSGGATDVDITSNTSALCTSVALYCVYSTTGTAPLRFAPKGYTEFSGVYGTSTIQSEYCDILVDEDGIFTYNSGLITDTVSVFILLNGYYMEWES